MVLCAKGGTACREEPKSVLCSPERGKSSGKNMIERERLTPWQLLYRLRGSIVPYIWKQVVAVSLLAALVCLAEERGWIHIKPIIALPFSLIGIALSIFAGFRNSASYDRWWEGRKLWGQLVVESRSLVRQVDAYMPDKERGRRIGLRTAAFAHALRHHLRGGDSAEELSGILGVEEAAKLTAARNIPGRLLESISGEIGEAMRAGEVSDRIVQVLEERLATMSGILAGCERIKLTPLPLAYTLLLHRTAYLFCGLLPFGLVDAVGFWAPPIAAILSYTFFGLDALGTELEDPFAATENGLRLDVICETIEGDIREMIGLDMQSIRPT